MIKIFSEMKEGEIVKVFDPDTLQIKTGTITRIARNGLRIDQHGYGEVAAKLEISGIWGNPGDEKAIENLLRK